MADIKDRKGKLIENLQDARCDQTTIQACLELAEKGEKKKFLNRLYVQRKQLVGAMHDDQRAIDCLDYLIFQMERKG
jgi:hypothetical protein